ncbi:MAG: hypothetical protein J6K48_01345 [Lachnospiraceae bacterium]|nr:hypothetical protein [Lachnospiraceae bacterium]
MAKGLLLGNGINTRIGIHGLTISEIKERFRYNMYKSAPVLEALFEIILSRDTCNNIIQESESDGIESLAGSLYEYVKKHEQKKWTVNDEIRLQDTVSCIALTSIFYDKKGKIDTSYDAEKLLDISAYDRIFSLNYVEFWDKKQSCIYLHGKIDFDTLENQQNMLLLSSERNKLQAYKEAIKVIEKTNNIELINTSDIVFAPNGIPKEKLICASGIFTSNNLYPADDLFLHRRKELYKRLEDVDELDIFGVSPYGDSSLVNIINQLKSVTIFIYNKSTNKETEDWKKILHCPYKLKDSLEV